MKRVAAFIVSVCCLLALVACSEESTVTSSSQSDQSSVSAQQKEYSVTELGNLLHENATYEDDIQPLGDTKEDTVEFVSAFYSIDQSLIDEAVFYSGSGATPEEICVIKAAAGKCDDIKAAMDARVAALKHDFTDYNPEQMPKIDKAIIYTNGDYAVLSISCDEAQATQVIENYFK